jgi:hypothetical protein
MILGNIFCTKMLLKRPSIKLLAIELETYTQNLLPKIRWLQ